MRTLPAMSLDPRTGTAPDGAGDAVTGVHPQAGASIAAPLVAPPVAPVVAPVPDDGSSVRPPRRSGRGGRSGRASAPPRRGAQVEARQVQRLVTRVDPWSMLKVSLFFALSLWMILVIAGIVLWRVAVATGTIGKFENFLAQILAEQSFVIDGMQILRASVVGGLVLVVTGAVFSVVFTVLFNLIAGVAGGVRFSVVELETARRTGDRSSVG